MSDGEERKVFQWLRQVEPLSEKRLSKIRYKHDLT